VVFNEAAKEEAEIWRRFGPFFLHDADLSAMDATSPETSIQLKDLREASDMSYRVLVSCLCRRIAERKAMLNGASRVDRLVVERRLFQAGSSPIGHRA